MGVGEALELIDRRANGWVLVKPIGRIREPGLLPEAYVRIVDVQQLAEKKAGDSSFTSIKEDDNETQQETQQAEEEDLAQAKLEQEISALTQRSNSDLNSMEKSARLPDTGSSSSVGSYVALEDKLPSKSSSVSTMDSYEFQTSSFKQQLETLHDVVEPLSIPAIRSRPSGPSGPDRPIAGCVKNVSAHNNRYWYRVDLQMAIGERRFLCRYYQDFYKLHLSIVARFADQPSVLESLPVLPEPLPRPDLTTVETILLTRVQQLNVYFFRIVSNKQNLDYHDIVQKWIELRGTDFHLAKTDQPPLGQEIDSRLNPGTKPAASVATSTIFQAPPLSTGQKQSRRPTLSIQTSTTPPLPSVSSFSTLNNNNNSMTWSNCSDTAVSTSARSPKLWQSIKYKRSHSEASSIYSSCSTGPIHSANSQLSNSSGLTPRNRTVSTPITPIISSNFARSCSELRLKLIVGNDIIALKINDKFLFEELVDTVRRRLDLPQNRMLKLYCNVCDDRFIPLLNDKDLQTAFAHDRVLIKAEI